MKEPLTISISTPAFTAFSAASLRSLQNPCATISVADAQSVTTIPSYFHSLRSTSFRIKLFPVEGIPSLSLNEVIKVAHPALATASKGGR